MSSLVCLAARGTLSAAEPAAEPVTEQAAPTCQTLPPLRYLPLKINLPLFTEPAGISLTDSDGHWRTQHTVPPPFNSVDVSLSKLTKDVVLSYSAAA